MQANPSWAKFKKSGLPYYKELCIIFGDSYARGDLAVSQSTHIPDPVSLDDDDMEFNVDEVQSPIKETGIDDVRETEEELPSHPNPTVNRDLDRTPTAKRKRSRTANVNNAIAKIGALCDAKLDDRKQNHTVSSNNPSKSVSDVTIQACQQVLDSIEDLPTEVYVKAVKRMWEDSKWRDSFISTKPEKRIIFLNMLE